MIHGLEGLDSAVFLYNLLTSQSQRKRQSYNQTHKTNTNRTRKRSKAHAFAKLDKQRVKL